MSNYFRDVSTELDDCCRVDYDGWCQDAVEKYNFFIGFYLTRRTALSYLDADPTHDLIDYEEYSSMFRNNDIIRLASELFTPLRCIKRCSSQFFFKDCSDPRNDWKQIGTEIQENGKTADGKKACKKYQEFFLGLDVSRNLSWMDVVQLVKATGELLKRLHIEYTDEEKLVTWFVKYMQIKDGGCLGGYVNYGEFKTVTGNDTHILLINETEREHFGQMLMNICQGLGIPTDYKRIYQATDEEFFAHFITISMRQYINISKDVLKIVENRTRLVKEVPESIFSLVPYNLTGKFGCMRKRMNIYKDHFKDALFDSHKIDSDAVLDLTDIRKAFARVSHKATKWMLLFCYPDETTFFLMMVPNITFKENGDELIYYFFYKGDNGNSNDTFRLYEMLSKQFMLMEEHIGFIYSNDAPYASSRLKKTILSIFKKEKESMFNSNN